MWPFKFPSDIRVLVLKLDSESDRATTVTSKFNLHRATGPAAQARSARNYSARIFVKMVLFGKKAVVRMGY